MRLRIDMLEDATEMFHDAMMASERTMEDYSNFIVRSTIQRVKHKIRNAPRGGRTYFRKNPDRIVTASAPGEPPASDLGNLADSYTFQLYNTASRTAYAGSDLYYAIDLEFGTFQITARPVLLPSFLEAIEAERKNLKKIYQSYI